MHRISLPLVIAIALVVTLAAASLSVEDVRLSVLGLKFERVGLRLGLDLRGGSHLVYKTDMPNPTEDQMAGVVNKIERRVNAFGVAEPVIQRMGSDRVLVQLPGIKNVEEAKKLIGETAFLEFKERTLKPDATFEDKEVGLTGANLANAYASTHSDTGRPIVNFEFDSEGGKIFGDLTTRIAGTGNQIAIFLDGKELLSPVAERPILGGRGFIEGRDFTLERVRTISIQLNAGALDVPISIIQEQVVDASLGADSLRKSVVAGFAGLGLVAMFMVLYYRFPGLLASLALLMYSVMVLAIFKLLPVTLTLAGVAAFILSVGMAVDANVLIFERMKEELRRGRSLLAAIETGFDRAWPSIRDSNVSTFMTCGILYWFGSRLGASLITGFALTLFIGVAVSMFSAITVTRTLLRASALTPVARWLTLFLPAIKTRTEAKALSPAPE